MMKIFFKSFILVTILTIPAVFVFATPNVKPVVFLNGNQYEVLTVGGTWTDSGATASDVEDGNLTGSIVVSGSVNTAVPDIYQIKYSVTDSGSKIGEKIRYVVVVEASKNGNPACSDGLDNDFDGLIDENDVGCYIGGGQKTVIDPAKYNPNKNSENAVPDLVLVGDEHIDITKGTPFVEPGFSANDQEDGDLTSTVNVSGTVNTNVPGLYKIFYNNYDDFTFEVKLKDDIKSRPVFGATTQNWRQVLRYVTVKDPVVPPTPTPPALGAGGNTDTVLKIYDEKVGRISPNSVLVSWKTNTPADSNVGFGTTTVGVENMDKGQQYGYSGFSTNKAQPSTRDHFVVLTGIDPAAKYFLRAGSETNTLKDVSSELVVNPVIETPTYQTPTGVCVKYLNSYIKSGNVNNANEVLKLQKFLNEYEGENLEVNGIYDEDTIAAVNRFQLKYRSDILDPWGSQIPTKFVYYTTQKKINEIVCAKEFPLNDFQKNEIRLYKKLIEEGDLAPEGTIGFNNQNNFENNSTKLLSVNNGVDTQVKNDNATGSEQIASVAGSESGWQKFKSIIRGIFNKIFGNGEDQEKVNEESKE